MYKVIRKIFIFIVLFVITLFITSNLSVKGTTETWVDYEYGDSELYSKTNTYNYNENTTFDMSDRNAESYTENTNTQPILTVLTHGLGGSAKNWSLKNGSFTYCEDSLITRLTNVIGGDAYIYKYIVKENELTTYDLGKQNEKIINGRQASYQENSSTISTKIKDISKPIIILFETANKYGSNNDVYADFNYAISKAVYDIKLLNNGVLPKINLIGHSRGGLTNLQYALDHPDLVHSMYSIGTPYLGSTSASIDIDTLQIGGGDIGEEDIINPNIYMDYYNRWNNGWNSLYRNIKVHAIGGYSTTMFLQHIFGTEYAREKVTLAGSIGIITAIEKIERLEFFHNSNELLIPDFLYEERISEIVQYLKDILNLEDDSIIDALESIILKEMEFDSCYPFLAWHNDGFVDLKSQVGKKTFNNNLLEYEGFNRFEKKFTISNSDISKLAKEDIPIVHNLETRDKDILDYIVKNISMSGKIDELYETYDIGSNEIGIRTILKNVSHTTLQIPSTINGKTVVEIAPSAFSNDFNSNRYITGQHAPITKVIIPNTVRKIGANAFENCSELRIVEFESNSLLYEIGDYAFYNCPLLNSINTPSNIILGECIFLNNNLILDEEYNSEIYSKVNNLGSINCMMEELRGDYYLYKKFSMHFKFSVECEYEYDFNAIADEGIKMWLYDSNLELLFEESTSINDGTNTAIIENLTPGDYYLRITAEDGSYQGSVEVIVDNDIAEKEELAVDTETDVLEHLHNGHNEFFFMRNKTDFYEFWLIAEDSGEVIFPEGAITIFDSNGNIVEKFTIDNLDYSNSADSIYLATSITVLIEEYMNYYIHIDIDPNIEYSSLKIVALSLGARNLDSEDNLVETDNKIGDKIDIINVERTGHYDLDITYNGNQEEEILYVILKKDSNNNFTLIDKFLLNSENNAINENYIFNGGEVLYIGYFNYLGNGNIKLEINRIIKQKFDLMIDPNMNVVVGTEVSVNEGSCNETTITQGYTRVCYLGMYAPNLDSRMLYEWSSSDETIAKVSSYGTITATATWTDNATCKKVKIKATYQSNITIVGEIEIEVYKDTRTDEKYLQYGMDVRETSPITGNEVTTGKGYPIPVSTSPTVVIHKSNTRLICLGNDSPSKIIQDFTWTSLDPSVAVVSQYGTITGYHSGETKILGVYKYNPRFKVEIILVVVTGL